MKTIWSVPKVTLLFSVVITVYKTICHRCVFIYEADYNATTGQACWCLWTCSVIINRSSSAALSCSQAFLWWLQRLECVPSRSVGRLCSSPGLCPASEYLWGFWIQVNQHLENGYNIQGAFQGCENIPITCASSCELDEDSGHSLLFIYLFIFVQYLSVFWWHLIFFPPLTLRMGKKNVFSYKLGLFFCLVLFFGQTVFAMLTWHPYFVLIYFFHFI